MKIGVIGAGIGGLATAIRLANKGHRVTVYEKNDLPGGKMSEIRADGYRFDTGPSLFTLPHLIESLFEECGEVLRDYINYSLLDNNCKYFFSDGMVFNFYHNKEKLKKEIEEKTIESFDNIEKRLNESEELYTISAPVFLFNAFQKISNFTTPPFRNIVFQLHKLNFGKTMHNVNKQSFKDPRMVQLFDRYATYNGSNPYQAPATLNMITHLENNIGAFFPDRGMYSIVQSLYKLALKKGVQFEFNSQVSEIIITNKKASALRIGNTIINCDTIVSDADAKYVANNLFKSPLKNRLNKSTPSSSALIFYWGIKKEFPKLDIHNILFSADYNKEFKSIFEEKSITQDPSIYIFISSKQVPTDAPKSCENWFVMINVPPNKGQNWDLLIREARKDIVEKINSILNTDIESYIECEHIGSPLTIEANTMSADGALYGTASNSMFSAFLRHPNFIRGINNLYFVGGSVHPGGGIPLCIASSEIVSKEIPPASYLDPRNHE
ncbi:MAG: phytoene desaturase [Bacteroidota bacterium]|jgi:phytoene desaturase